MKWTEFTLRCTTKISFFSLKKWFDNRQKRETLRVKRDEVRRKVNTTQHNSIRLNDYLTSEIQPFQMCNMSASHRNNLLHSNTQSNVGMNCDVLLSDEIEITAVKKCNNYKVTELWKGSVRFCCNSGWKWNLCIAWTVKHLNETLYITWSNT